MQLSSDQQSPLVPSYPSLPNQFLVQTGDLVFIDTSLNNYCTLAAAIDQAEVVLLDSQQDGIAQITNALAGRQGVKAMHLISHGDRATLQLGHSQLSHNNIGQYQDALASWSSALSDTADILLYGCDVAGDATGLDFIAQLASLTGADIAASTNVTGSAELGGDWGLEATTGQIEATVPLNAAMQAAFREILPITVYAAGATNQEQMQLQIDGQTVQTWNNIGGNFNNRQFVAYTYDGTNVDPGRIRVRFTNDRYEPANNIDRNLRVDRIQIGNQTYQTEDPQVFSTGTWKPADGIVPGFRESEILHANGYFQFAGDTSGNNGDLIEVRARGDEGTERFSLEIAGNTVANFRATQTFQTFSFRASGDVQADDVRVNFLNDQYNPAQGIDSNLVVDFIRIDGTTYQTEAPEVFSTGTWKSADGIVPGFRESEVLHANGYFQYAGGGGNQPGIFEVDTNDVIIREDGGNAIVRVNRVQGSSGTATVQYITNEATAQRGSDFTNQTGTLTFADGQTTRTVAIPIVNDNIAEPTETFSFAILGATGAALGTQRTVGITILDDDAASAQFAFSQAAYNIKEDGGTAQIIVERSGSSSNIATVQYSTANGSATAGPDYTATSGTLTFAAGETSKTFNVQVINDTLGERNETVNLRLSSPTGGTLGGQSNAVLNILDNDPGDFTRETLITDLTTPTAMEWTEDGQHIFIAEQNGLVKVANASTNQLQSSPFIDLRNEVNGVRDRGLLGLELDPKFNSGRPFVYLLYTYDPPEAGQTNRPGYNPTFGGQDKPGNRPGRLIRVEAEFVNGQWRAKSGTTRVLLGTNSTFANTRGFDSNSTIPANFNIPASGFVRDANGNNTNVSVRDYIAGDSESHTVGYVQFGADGALYVSIGDGTSYNAADPRTVRVQDLDNLSGKLLRIDPNTGLGLADNPFATSDLDSNRSKVFNLGLRNPFRFTFNPDTNLPVIGDVGWFSWEEVNTGRGKNFGWPAYEGGLNGSNNPTNLRTPNYQNLAGVIPFYPGGSSAINAQAPLFAFQHQNPGGDAIVMGDFYTGNTFPVFYDNALFYANASRGTVNTVLFDQTGQVAGTQLFADNLFGVVNLKQGPDGNLYYVNLGAPIGGATGTGSIGRWRLSSGANANAPALLSAPASGTSSAEQFFQRNLFNGRTAI